MSTMDCSKTFTTNYISKLFYLTNMPSDLLIYLCRCLVSELAYLNEFVRYHLRLNLTLPGRKTYICFDCKK